MIKTVFGACAWLAVVVVCFVSLEGVYGVSIGSDDDLTRWFVRACAALKIGG